ncbi:hypothetical protein NBH20_01450 [Rhizobium sp. S153]|uniref:Uncharacterized protein n=1 Tax=Ciceribacter sichuanensis TaxID=2949647 RepID=A0ABT0V499_9HYPH|nr:hypothetical protein [Ciceribacter sp. S153]MCM2399807.1 hypothetical protein [Ciceribacter sp. S153]
MVKYAVSNAGLRAQAIRVAGGTITVKAGKSADVDLAQAPDDETVAHFKARGVTFVEVKKKKPVAPSSDASAALAAAEAAVAVAQEKLVAAGDDLAAKAEAETDVKAAEAALATLKA